MKKRLLSLLLALAMVFSVLPVASISVSADTVDLPDGYQEIEYLEFTKNEYIRTGVMTGADIELDYTFSFQKLDSAFAAPLAARKTNMASSISFAATSSSTAFSFGNNSEISNSSLKLEAGTVYHIKQNKNSLYINDTEYHYAPSQEVSFADPLELYIGARNENGSLQLNYTGKIYNVKIMDDGILIRDYVPAFCEASKECGLYDMIEGKFVGSSKQKLFSPDSNYYTFEPTEYVVTDGLSYIDTGVPTAEDIRLEYKFSFDDLNASYYSAPVAAYHDTTMDSAITLSATLGRTAFAFGEYAENSTDQAQGQVDTPVTAMETDVAYTVVQDSSGVSINGEEYDYPTTQTTKFLNPHNIYVGARNVSDKAQMNFKGRIYYVKIYKGGELIREYQPVIETETGRGRLHEIKYDTYSDPAFKPAEFYSTKTSYLPYISVKANGAYLDTGVPTAEDIRLEYTFSMNAWNDSYYVAVVAARKSASNSSISFAATSKDTAISFGGTSESNSTTAGVELISLNKKYSICQDKDSVNINGEDYFYLNSQTMDFSSPLNIYVGGRNENGSVQTRFNGNIYGVKIYKAGELIRDYIPAKQTNLLETVTRYGFYDTVSDQFYESTNSSAGFDFIPLTEVQNAIANIQNLLEGHTDYRYYDEVRAICDSGYLEGYTVDELNVFAADLENSIADDSFINGENKRVFITTAEAWNPIAKTDYVTARLTIVDENENVICETPVDDDLAKQPVVKVRGNSTAKGPKKPYNIKFTSKQDVFGMGSAKKWTLLADCYDPSLLRNHLALDLGEDLGIPYTSKHTEVEVWVNGSYKGAYLLCESVETNSSRVDIDTENGDFLLERDTSTETGVSYVNSSINNPNGRFAVSAPSTPTSEQLTSIQNVLAEIDTAINSGNEQTIREKIDVESFVRYYLLMEYMKPVDAGRRSEYYYYKDGKLYAGPAWDFDGSSGDNTEIYGGYYAAGGAENGSDTFYANKNYFAKLLEYDWFTDLVKLVFVEYRDSFTDMFELGGKIDRLLSKNGDLYSLNYATKDQGGAGWDVAKKYWTNRKDPKPTFEENVEYLRSYLSDRYTWLNEQWNTENLVYVQFETGDGSAVDPQLIVNTETVTKPEDPTRVGFKFGGWYSDSDCNTVWNFEETVTENTTLYANWIAFSYEYTKNADDTYTVKKVYFDGVTPAETVADYNALPSEVKNTIESGDLIHFKGGSLRYADAEDGKTNMRHGYKFTLPEGATLVNDTAGEYSFGWDYYVVRKNPADLEQTQKSASKIVKGKSMSYNGDTYTANIVFTNIPQYYFNKYEYHTQMYVTFTLNGVTYTCLDWISDTEENSEHKYNYVGELWGVDDYARRTVYHVANGIANDGTLNDNDPAKKYAQSLLTPAT